MNIKTGATYMIRTAVILDLLKEKLGSDYKSSLALGKLPNFVASVRSRNGILSDDVGLKAAQLLDFPEDAILLSLAAERALNSENFQIIQRLAQNHTPDEVSEMVKKAANSGDA